MDRSLRFGSRSCHYNALFRLAFATTTPHGLTSRQNTNSQAHSSKGTPPPHTTGAITACKHTVSGTLSLPSRGTFHHSLTVLIRYRSSGGIQAAEWSRQIHTGFHGPRATREHHHAGPPVLPTGLSPTTAPLPRRFGYQQAFSLRPATAATGTTMPHNPTTATPAGYTHDHGLTIIRFRSPLLTEYLLLRVLRCFTSPRHPPHPIQFRCR